MGKKGYDPRKLGGAFEQIVTRDGDFGLERKYFKSSSINPMNKKLKFRISHFYRGSSVADIIGCNLRCIFCWAKDEVIKHPDKVGTFCSPLEVALNLMANAKFGNCKNLRISGGEPTLYKEHLIRVLEEIQQNDYQFILETNGIVLGYDMDLIKRISEFQNIHVRISLKGASPERFNFVTGAKKDFYYFQLKALENCLNYNIDCHPVIMLDFIDTKNELLSLKSVLQNIEPDLIKNLEFERLFLYPHVKKRLDKYNIPYKLSYNG